MSVECRDNSCSIERVESIYTCPMHPEIQEKRAGSCPKCGMALEPMDLVAEEENAELEYMSRRFWVSVGLALPVFIVAMISDLIPHYIPEGISMLNIQWFEFLLATPVVIWAGWPFFVRGYNSVVSWNLNMFTLIAIGVGAAYTYSLVALFAPELFPPLMQTEDGLVHVYFEAAAVITSLVLLGQVLELNARSKTNNAIKTLLNLAPKQAHRVDADGVEKSVNLEDVVVGDFLRIKPGEKIPVDGVVYKGQSSIDESMITGEAVLIAKSQGDKLIGATLNKNGTLLMRAEKVGDETLLAQIVAMVSHAQRSRAPIQKLADSVSSYFVPAVVISAVLAFLGWWLFGPEPRVAYAIVSAVAVLIIACPCALGLATPISIMVATGRAALMGILIKDAQTLETMERVTTLVLDKTGTLTEGKPTVTAFKVIGDFKEKKLIEYAASLERLSEHPLSQAVVDYGVSQEVEYLEVEDFESVTGRGVLAHISGNRVTLGSEKFLNELGIKTLSIKEGVSEFSKDGKGLIFMAVDDAFCGVFVIKDPIKSSSLEAIKRLQEDGIHIVMLSGDSSDVAQDVADKLGIDEVHADVMPEGKIERIKILQSSGAIVAMAGDGINDAPALAQADVGIAMGTGTDVAIESAGVTLIKGDLLGIVKVLKLSRVTMKNIRQNLFFAFIYNSAGVPIAAGVLFPFFGVLLSPVIAAAAMSFSSVSVILNALRLKNIELD